jgi:hypothetical protein
MLLASRETRIEAFGRVKWKTGGEFQVSGAMRGYFETIEWWSLSIKMAS